MQRSEKEKKGSQGNIRKSERGNRRTQKTKKERKRGRKIEDENVNVRKKKEMGGGRNGKEQKENK